MLSQDFLYQLKQSNPIETVMGRYVQLIRAGNLLKCQCPFHSEKTPSCVVYAGTQDPHFYCFGCHAGGDVITFLMKIEGVGYMDAVAMLAQSAGMEVPVNEGDAGEAKQRARLLELNRAAARFFFDALCGTDKRGLQYLSQRGIQPQIVKKFGLGYADGSWDGMMNAMRKLGFSDEEMLAANLVSRQKNGGLFDRFRNRVMFPIFDLRGSVIAFGGRTIETDGTPKYLNSSDTPVFRKGRNLFALQFAKKSQSKRLILAEGYMDVIAVHQGGFENVVASLGTALTGDQCRLMRQYADEVVIAYDSDAAGQNATIKAVNLLRSVGIRPRVLHMEGAKDPDEYLKKFGAGRFRLLLEEADDAIHFALERCKSGVEDTAEDGVITVIQKAIPILAEIQNPLERDVYLSKLAKEQEVDAQLLREQVQREMRRRQKSEQKHSWQSLTTQPLLRDAINPEAVGNRREAKAEEEILCYLFRNPDAMASVAAQIAPEQFVTELNRRIYQCYQEQLPQYAQFSLSMFSDRFTPDEMGRITGIEAKHSDIVISEKAVCDCIALLLQHSDAEQAVEKLSDDDFAEWMQRKRNG